MVDFDLHGLVGLRLLGASPADVAAVTRQIGPLHAPHALRQKPDLIVRFVERLEVAAPIRYLGAEGFGFTADAFLLLRGGPGSRPRARIALDQVGDGCEIVCERGAGEVPLLVPILNLLALARGALPLHASAFTYRGAGVIVAGGAGSSKTGTLLAFMAHGAEFVGDDGIYLRGDGRMFGLPAPLTVKAGYLRDVPAYGARIGRRDRARLGALQAMGAMLRALPVSARASGRPAQIVSRVAGAIERRQCVTVAPEQLFGPKACAMTGCLDRLFVAISHAAPQVVVRPVAPAQAAERLAFSLQSERLELMACYWKFRFAFPECRCALIEEAEAIQRRMLAKVLADREVYALYHPYPVRIPVLFEAVAPWTH